MSTFAWLYFTPNSNYRNSRIGGRSSHWKRTPERNEAAVIATGDGKEAPGTNSSEKARHTRRGRTRDAEKTNILTFQSKEDYFYVWPLCFWLIVVRWLLLWPCGEQLSVQCADRHDFLIDFGEVLIAMVFPLDSCALMKDKRKSFCRIWYPHWHASINFGNKLIFNLGADLSTGRVRAGIVLRQFESELWQNMSSAFDSQS